MLHINQKLFLSVASLALLSSCGTEDLTGQADPLADGGAEVNTASPAPTATPTPTPVMGIAPPPPLGNVELPIVNSGLNVDSLLNPMSIPPSGQPDVVGAFRFLCAPSHLSYDDPVVHPGKPGAAHLHQFFGNTQANANSTYESLRKTGDSTCTSVLNRSAYWMPALLDGQGSALVPNYVAIYYKRRPSSDVWFANAGNAAADIPRGLRYVFGNPDTPSVVSFKCVNGWTPVGTAGSMTHALNQCAVGQKLLVSVVSPDCWDGKNLDSADHRSHMSYKAWDGVKSYCPASHPYVLAQFTMTAEWNIEAGDTPAVWRFSSDMDGSAPGASFHADWFGAWEDSIMKMWHENCIDKLLNCSDGDLGNGKIMKRNSLYPTMKADPRKVPIHTIG